MELKDAAQYADWQIVAGTLYVRVEFEHDVAVAGLAADWLVTDNFFNPQVPAVAFITGGDLALGFPGAPGVWEPLFLNLVNPATTGRDVLGLPLDCPINLGVLPA